MQPAAHEQGLSERRSSSSPFDNSGIALDRLPGLTSALEAACADLPAALRPLLGEGVRAALEEIQALCSKPSGIASAAPARFCAARNSTRACSSFSKRAPPISFSPQLSAPPTHSPLNHPRRPDAPRTTIETRLL
jgi:hypothetical protein